MFHAQQNNQISNPDCWNSHLAVKAVRSCRGVSGGESPAALSTQSTAAEGAAPLPGSHCRALLHPHTSALGHGQETTANKGAFHVKWRLKVPLQPALSMSRDPFSRIRLEMSSREMRDK